jgi:hypothetical protein
MKIVYTYHEVNSRVSSIYDTANSESTDIFKTYQKLSFLLTRKNYPGIPIILKTNTYGWNTIQDLNLSWDKVDICLDEYNNIDKEHWCYVKMRSMFNEEPPFLHLDYDVFLEKNILDDIKGYKVVYQSPEALLGNSYYETFIKKRKKELKPTNLAYNAGFVYINTDISTVKNLIENDYFEKYDIGSEYKFTTGIGVEQMIIPDILKKENPYDFTTLAKLQQQKKDFTSHTTITITPPHHCFSLPAFGYSHFISKAKISNFPYIKKTLKNFENNTPCLA